MAGYDQEPDLDFSEVAFLLGISEDTIADAVYAEAERQWREAVGSKLNTSKDLYLNAIQREMGKEPMIPEGVANLVEQGPDVEWDMKKTHLEAKGRTGLNVEVAPGVWRHMSPTSPGWIRHAGSKGVHILNEIDMDQIVYDVIMQLAKEAGLDI